MVGRDCKKTENLRQTLVVLTGRRPSPLSAHYTRASFAHADSYARGRPGLKHHVR